MESLEKLFSFTSSKQKIYFIYFVAEDFCSSEVLLVHLGLKNLLRLVSRANFSLREVG